jgi:flagellum-specific ATP synthase
MRSILDGHIMLDRVLVSRSQYPAIDVLQSVSRLNKFLQTKDQQQQVAKIKSLISCYEESREMIEMGLYVKNTNKETDMAIELKDEISAFLKQSEDELSDRSITWSKLEKLYRKANGAVHVNH